MEINLGFEITDEELISMDPELLIKLQKFLKEHQASQKHVFGSTQQKCKQQ